MAGSSSEPPPEDSAPHSNPPSAARARSARYLLPSPVSTVHAVVVLILGFAVEGATEVYQFLARGDLVQGPLEYYTTLATTVFGFYLMFLGLREWHAFHPRPKRRTLTPGKRRWPWFGLSLWAGGTAMTGLLSILLGGWEAQATPFWVAWPVGGIVVLAFGNFFFGLRREAHVPGSSWGNGLGWASFTWSLGTATVAGLVVGDRTLLLLTEFVTSWVALIASIGPIVVAMSPLFVTYALLIATFGLALRIPRNGIP